MPQWKRKNRHVSRAVPPQPSSIRLAEFLSGGRAPLHIPAPARYPGQRTAHLIGAHCEAGRRMREAAR